jgi:hypothetical protein
MLAGWRTGEALGLRRGEVDLARRTATLADTKIGRSIRPLSHAACDVLKTRCRMGFRTASGRQCEMKSGAMWQDRRCPKAVPMGLNNRGADRQTHAHAARLGGEEGIEDAVRICRIEAEARILDGDNWAAIVRALRCDRQRSLAMSDGSHRLDGIHDEVQHHLL